MKKLIFFGSLFTVGSLLTGCGTTEGKLISAEQRLISNAENIDEIVNIEETQKVLSPLEELERENERIQRETDERNDAMTSVQGYGKEVYKMEDYWLRIPEYKDVKTFTIMIQKSFEEEKNVEEVDVFSKRGAERHAANVVVTYINWFKDEIEELGLAEVFNKWQLAAYEIEKTNSVDAAWYDKHDSLVVEFEAAMYKAVDAINNLDRQQIK